MNRYLAYTSPARGHLFPIVRTLLELRERGHDIHLRTLESEVELMRTLGFEAQPVDPAIEQIELDDWTVKSPIGAERRGVEIFLKRARFDAADLERSIGQVKPDAVFVDVNTWGAAAIAEAWGGPWALFTPYSVPIASRDAPPFGLGLTPRRGILGRVRDGVARKLVLTPLERRIFSQINELRASLGLRSVKNATEFFSQVVRLLVYYSAEPFEYPRSDWPSSVRLVGPGVWDPPAMTPQWLDRIDKPLVLVTCSTEFQNDGKLIEVALEALADESLAVVATTGAVDISGLKVPSWAHVEPFLPHTPLLARAECVVCHGGMGITQKALSAGVPVVAVPFGRDQFEVARRVVVSRAGARLTASRQNPERLRRAVRDAMSMRPGAERIAAAFAEAGGPSAAATALENVVKDFNKASVSGVKAPKPTGESGRQVAQRIR